jgi:signal transduction histidine kinase
VALLSADRLSFMIHTLGTVVAGAIYLFFSGEKLAIFFGVLGILVGVGLVRSGLYMNAALLDALNLANEKSRLVNEVTAAIAAVAATNASLEVEIQERRRVERELIAARDQADVANRAKSQFLANMSHEIRTPLNGVIGFTELLETTKLDAEQQYQVDHIKTSAAALLDVISDVLDFSKIEAGRMELHARPQKLVDVLLPCPEIVRASAIEKSLALHVDVDIDPNLTVQVDSVKLRQVLLNFLGNAVKFTKNGSVAFRASFVPDAHHPRRGLLRVSIEDTGIGIDAETQTRLFEPFTQGDASKTRRYGGSGLGLAISKHLTTLMTGRIELRSTPGAGTVITVFLPLDVVA